jgi:hypothetical protein
LLFDHRHEVLRLADFEDEFQRLMSFKSLPLDFLSKSPLKASSEILEHVMAQLPNMSNACRSFPTGLLLKQQVLDDTDTSIYRPICSLDTMTKILER